MPTYEYICEKCGHEFEQVQSISDPPLKVCPKEVCVQKRWGKGKVRRAISGGAGLLFKGSGFYITDYRSESYKQAARKETASAGGDSKSGSGSGSGSGTSASAPAANQPAATRAAKNSG